MQLLYWYEYYIKMLKLSRLGFPFTQLLVLSPKKAECSIGPLCIMLHLSSSCPLFFEATPDSNALQWFALAVDSVGRIIPIRIANRDTYDYSSGSGYSGDGLNNFRVEDSLLIDAGAQTVFKGKKGDVFREEAAIEGGAGHVEGLVGGNKNDRGRVKEPHTLCGPFVAFFVVIPVNSEQSVQLRSQCQLPPAVDFRKYRRRHIGMGPDPRFHHLNVVLFDSVQVFAGYHGYLPGLDVYG